MGGIERGERNVCLVNIEKIANGLKIPPAGVVPSGLAEPPARRQSSTPPSVVHLSQQMRQVPSVALRTLIDAENGSSFSSVVSGGLGFPLGVFPLAARVHLLTGVRFVDGHWVLQEA